MMLGWCYNFPKTGNLWPFCNLWICLLCVLGVDLLPQISGYVL